MDDSKQAGQTPLDIQECLPTISSDALAGECHPPEEKVTIKWGRLVLDWKWEIVAAFVALMMLIFEILVLAIFGEADVKEWKFGKWSIGSLLGLLTSVLDAAISFVVGACLGQLRWLWFRNDRGRRLEWLDIMTSAKSAPGAAKFILTPGSQRHIAILGAFIILALMGTSTFTQNIVTPKLNNYTVGINDTSYEAPAYIPVVTNYTSYLRGPTDATSDQRATPPMMAAIQAGFAWPSDYDALSTDDLGAFCNTGNCAFDSYQTLAVCGLCVNTTASVINPCVNGSCSNNSYYTLAQGLNVSLTLDAQFGFLNMTSDTLYPSDEAFSDIGPLIVRFDAMLANDLSIPGSGVMATECAAWWCVPTYNDSVISDTNNATVLYENPIEWTNTSARTSYLQEEPIILNPEKCLRNGSNISDPFLCHHVVLPKAQAGLQTFLTGGDTSAGFLSGSTTVHSIESNDAHWNSTTFAAGTLAYLASAWGIEPMDLNQYVEDSFNNMTTYMSNEVRKDAWHPYPYDTDPYDTNPYTYGNTTDTHQIYHVRWAWIAFPSSLVALAWGFLVATMFRSRHYHAWKSSTLAMIFHGFNDADRQSFGQIETLGDMERAMKTHKVHLVHNGTGLGFKKHSRKGRHGPVEEVRNGGGMEAGPSKGPESAVRIV